MNKVDDLDLDFEFDFAMCHGSYDELEPYFYCCE